MLVRLFFVSVLVLLLTACPSSSDLDAPPASGGIIQTSPEIVYLRDDIETVRVEKPFLGAAGTLFPEALAQLSIDVTSTPAEECPVDNQVVLSCDNWSFDPTDTATGIYRVQVIAPALVEDVIETDIEVNALPKDSGSRRIVQATGGGAVFLADDGSVWSLGDEGLVAQQAFFTNRRAVATRLGSNLLFASRSTQLPSTITQVSATPLLLLRGDGGGGNSSAADVTAGVFEVEKSVGYGLALSADNTVYEWGYYQAQPRLQPTDPSVDLDLPPIGLVEWDVRELAELNAFAEREGVTWSQVLAIEPPDPIFQSRFLVEGLVGAALSTDGRVAVWGEPDTRYSNSDDFFADDISREPRWLSVPETVVQLSTTDGNLVMRLSDGSVRFSLGRSELNRPDFPVPQNVRGVVDATAISGSKILRADGSVYQWVILDSDGRTSVVPVGGISSATDLPDPTQNLAITASGDLMTWPDWEDPNTPPTATIQPVATVDSVATVSGGIVVDAACGRAWSETRSTGRSARPVIGLGSGAVCGDAEQSHVIHIIVAYNDRRESDDPRLFSLLASSGNVSCDGATRGSSHCWWTGARGVDPVFTVSPDPGYNVRDWRWDCDSTRLDSGLVALGIDSAQSICKLTLVRDESTEPMPVLRTLTVEVSGQGVVSSSPAGIDCGSTCQAAFEQGSEIMLTAAATANETFIGWADTGCTSDRMSAAISIQLDSDTTCIAAFRDNTPTQFAPVANINVTPISPVTAGELITFDGGGSSDIDGSVVAWSWDFDGDGVEDATGETVQFVYPTATQTTVTLTVTDDDGLSGSTAIPLTVTAGLSEPPVARFSISPSNSEPLGTTFQFDGSASTDDVGIISYEWSIGANGNVDGTGPTFSYTPLDIGIQGIRLQVTDADGQFSDLIQNVEARPNGPPRRVAIRIIVNGPGQVDVAPDGLTFPDSSCDGNECFIFDIPIGTTLTLQAAPFTPAVFQGWDSAECTNIPNPDTCEILMTNERTVTATFQ
ncbi:MAG: PKD domain-containing protein [Pseudomonadota bacterium]